MMGYFAEDSDGSLDSNSSEYYLRQEGGGGLNHRKRWRAVCKCWNEMGEETKKAWRVRATKLNARNLPGKIYNIPSKFYIVELINIYIC